MLYEVLFIGKLTTSLSSVVAVWGVVLQSSPSSTHMFYRVTLFLLSLYCLTAIKCGLCTTYCWELFGGFHGEPACKWSVVS